MSPFIWGSLQDQKDNIVVRRRGQDGRLLGAQLHVPAWVNVDGRGGGKSAATND